MAAEVAPAVTNGASHDISNGISKGRAFANEDVEAEC